MLRWGCRSSTPENSQSVRPMAEVMNTSVPMTAGGASADVVTKYQPEPMCIQLTVEVPSRAGSHVVVVDGAHPRLIGRVAGAGVEQLVARHQDLVHPEVGLGAVAAHAEDLVAVHPLNRVAVPHDLGAAVTELLGEALLPDVG